jgi:hypothetical protein
MVDMAKLEQLLYDVELYVTPDTDARILDKLRYVVDLFALVAWELEIDYNLQESIKTFGDKRKKE